jgi:RNA polymerase sigma factor (sigma-70 family)
VDAELGHLLALARFLTRSEHDAWDLTQDTLVRVGLAWTRVDYSRNPRAYARKTMARLNSNRLRSLARDLRRPVDRSGQFVADHADHAERVEDREVLRSALRLLPPGQRTVLVMHYYEDLSVAEIADVMGLRPGTVKSQLHRARERLAPILEGSFPTEGSFHG